MSSPTLTILTGLLSCGGLTAEEPAAVRLARAELAVARAEKDVVLAEGALAVSQANAELTVKVTRLACRYATAKATLEAMPKTDPNHIKQRLIVTQLAEDLRRLKESGPRNLTLLQQLWHARTALATARVALAEVRLSVAVKKHTPRP